NEMATILLSQNVSTTAHKNVWAGRTLHTPHALRWAQPPDCSPPPGDLQIDVINPNLMCRDRSRPVPPLNTVSLGAISRLQPHPPAISRSTKSTPTPCLGTGRDLSSTLATPAMTKDIAQTSQPILQLTN